MINLTDILKKDWVWENEERQYFKKGDKAKTIDGVICEIIDSYYMAEGLHYIVEVNNIQYMLHELCLENYEV